MRDTSVLFRLFAHLNEKGQMFASQNLDRPALDDGVQSTESSGHRRSLA